MGDRRPILVFDGVGFDYVLGPTRVKALYQCDLHVLEGEWLAIMGANGSGKSSLARIAAGLVVPSTGRAVMCGEPTTSDRFRKARLSIGYLSQQPEQHVVGLTVHEDVAFGPRALGFSEEEVRRRADRWLHAVGLHGYRDRRTDTLSGGELQRVALAGVLALEPKLLILDEPTAFADPEMREELVHLVQGYHREAGAAVVWITHFSEEALAAERIVVLNKGHLVYDGTPSDLWRHTDLLPTWGIGPPASDGRPPALQQDPRLMRDQIEQLRMDDLRFRYHVDGPDVLQGVDVQVESGECVALTGSSGSGKSSLLQVAALLETHSAGGLHVAGEYIPTASNWRERRALRKQVRRIQPTIGLSFQQPESQLFGSKVQDDFEFGLRHLGVPEDEWADRIAQAIATVGFGTWVLERSPFALSGGERRKVAIALCLAQRPRLYLFDEPTAGLDYESRNQVAQAIRTISKDRDSAVLFATHDHELINACADRTVALHGGQVVSNRTDDRSPRFASKSDDALAESSRAAQQEKIYLGMQRVDTRLQVALASLLALTIATTRGWTGLAAASIVVGALSHFTQLRARQILPIVWGLLPFVIVATLFSSPQGAETSVGANTPVGPAQGLFFGWRMLLVVVSVLWLTRLSSVGDLLHAMRALCSPLNRLGVHVASLIAATLVGARMIPILTEEARKIYRSQVMRGVERIRGVRGVWLRLKSLSIPLTFTVVRRAELLGEALVTRGFSGEVIGASSPVVMQKREWVFVVSLSMAMLFILVSDIWGGRSL